MTTPTIRFDDGAAYERYMGVWSRLAGERFLQWLALAPNLRWLDVGCGNGAFTEMIVARCEPAAVSGIDPSEAQLAFARTRTPPHLAEFRRGDAMALPCADDAFDVAVMPLVLFFVPDPAKGTAEMARIVRPGGIVTAYCWDMPGGGFPYETLHTAMRAMGINVPTPPSPDASRLDAMQDLWRTAGLEAITAHTIAVERTFTDFDDYWATVLGGPSVGKQLAALSPADSERLAATMRARLPADASGRITYGAIANAVQGRVPS